MTRSAAIIERARNVLIDASAGTGKTRVLVDRLVELVAPHGELPAISIDRIAAITFTRKAAGELRVRTRHRLLEELADAGPRRARDLHAALTGLDTAQLATIHGFADHLLRKWPAQLRMDPYYELEDEEAILHRACVDALLNAADTGLLADEATLTLLAIERAGLRRRSRDAEHHTCHGLDSLIAAFAIHRDVELAEPPAPVFDRETFLRVADEYLALVAPLAASSPGARWLRELGAAVARFMHHEDPATIHGELAPRLQRPKLTKKRDFAGDNAGWEIWKALDGDERQTPVRVGALADDLLAPLRRWLAIRLARLRSVVLHVYDQVKAERRAVDHLDLLLRLRDLLRDDPEIRAHCQGLYDHLLVDELQDTDPVQAELIRLLCAAPDQPDQLAPGKLTLVGDPKQSIYRFRRADIATYDALRTSVTAGPHVPLPLTASWRSTPALVDWINQRFAVIMGAGARFSSVTGEVGYQPLARGRADGEAPAVHAISLGPGDDDSADAARQLEADAMARYLRWLVHTSNVRICDPLTGGRRAVRYGDIGVLALTTTNLSLLFAAFDRDGIPYAARGGTLFLADDLHRRFLLGLCAIADLDDGVAMTALLQPPFFALDLGDLARADPGKPDDRLARARGILRALRDRRFERPPGVTARALIEDTALGRVVALRPNGHQRLRGLYELCHQLELRALDGADFDTAVEALRRWVAAPIQLDRPLPVTGDAVRALTVHQAKGLEFPVVVLWDARAVWQDTARHEVWTVAADGTAWELRLDGLAWREPRGRELAEREHTYRNAERKRLVYVAATRARDLLIIPRLATGKVGQIHHDLLGPRTDGNLVHEVAPHAASSHAPWYSAAAPASPEPARSTTRDLDLAASWHATATLAGYPRLAPRGYAHAHSRWGAPGRHGTAFGQAVHVAIGRVLLHGESSARAVELAAARSGLDGHRAEAVADVERAIAALGWLEPGRFRLEYPIAGGHGEQLFAGYIDLVADDGEYLTVIDFKTDLPAALPAAVWTAYRDQVCGYARSLGAARAGLLFTADGEIRWMT